MMLRRSSATGGPPSSSSPPPEGPDIKDLVGWHRTVRMGGEGLLSTVTVSKSAEWFHRMAHDALERGIDEPFGFLGWMLLSVPIAVVDV